MRRPAYAHMARPMGFAPRTRSAGGRGTEKSARVASSLCRLRDADRREVLEPALRLHEALHARGERARVEVVGYEQHDRVAARDLVHLGDQDVAHLVVEGAHGLGRQVLDLLIEVPAPIAARGSPLLLHYEA